ncbi:MAG: GNAT family N-acetyltransferase [Chlamydiae bacterium]|nr:GNAT family N-acetyltransferase [Chlamydiota bacterium]
MLKITPPMHLSPIALASKPPYEPFDIVEKKSVKGVLRVAKMLTKWERLAITSKTSCDPAIRVHLASLANLCTLIYLPINQTQELFIEETASPKDDFTFALKALFSVDEPVLLVARDKKRRVQAIALHDKKTNELLYLLTNPKNLIFRGTKKAHRGAGSSLISYLANKTLEQSLPLKVTPLPHAREFYLKHDFEVVPSIYSTFSSEPGVFSSGCMRLTAEKIKKTIFDTSNKAI